MIETVIVVCIVVMLYWLAINVYEFTNQWPLLHPLLTTTLVLIVGIHFSTISLDFFLQHTRILDLLLGMATVALAVPLFIQLPLVLQYSWRLIVPIIIGGILSSALTWLTIAGMELPLSIEMTVLVKSITTPLAMETADLIGGIASLAAVLVVSTGLVVAIVAPLLFRILKVRDNITRGLVMGTVGHAIGTSKAVSLSQQAGAFASLALCVNGLTTAFLLPILFH